MAITPINVSQPNDLKGDKLRDAFVKVNANEADLDTTKADTTYVDAELSEHAALETHLPSGGDTGEVLTKVDGTGYNVVWAAVPAPSWGDITGKPSTFPPEAHSHDYLVPAGGGDGQVLTKQSATDGDVIWEDSTGGLGDHTTLTGRAEPDQHPIGAITGLQTALDGKAPDSHNHDGAYDALGSAAAVQGNLDTHEGDTGNPHGVTAAQAGAAPAVHTHLEADVTDLDKYTQGQVDAAVAVPQGDIDTHKLDTANPHEVTAAQAGATEEAPVDGTEYVRKDAAWAAATPGGASTFLALSDTPADYVGQAGKLAKVNPTEDGIIYGDPSGASVFWGDVQGTLSDQTDLQAELDAKSDNGHAHVVSDVTGLQTELNGKEPVISPKNSAFNKDFAGTGVAATPARSDHDHGATYSPVGHLHDDRYYTETEADAQLTGKSDTGHGHVIADTTGLQAALDGKSGSAHDHDGVYEPVIGAKGTAFNKNFGTLIGEVPQGNHNHDGAYDALGSAAAVQGNLDTHEGDTGNPHGVTAAQAGAEPVITPKNTAFNKDFGSGALDVAPGDHDHTGIYEPVISPKNTAFNKDFGAGAGQVAAGDHDHSGVYSEPGHAHVMTDVSDAGGMALVDDAPSDGLTYGRLNGAWSEAGGGGGSTVVSGAVRVVQLDDITSQQDGIKTTFDLLDTAAPVGPSGPTAVLVSHGGVIQEPTTDYSVTGTTIVFVTAPLAGIETFILWYESVYAGQWFVTASVPSDVLGNEGDMVLADDTGDVYGPKPGPTWGAASGNIMGPAGDAGAPGVGVPAGGTVGQRLEKIDSADHNTQWTTPTVYETQGAAAVVQGNLDTHEGASNPHSITPVGIGAEPANANIQTHIGTTTGNPHNVTAADAGADPAGSASTVQGNLDTHEGASNPHSITPAGIGAEVAGAAATVQGNLDTHEGATNPHSVTAADVGAVEAVTAGLKMEVVAVLPGTPDANTLYLVTG